jgi:putative addiction module component (TIGR02574 family)
MVAKNLLDDVLSLPAADRRELVEHIWESLQADPDAFPLTDEQRQTLERRAAEMERDPNLGSSWEDVKARNWPTR